MDGPRDRWEGRCWVCLAQPPLQPTSLRDPSMADKGRGHQRGLGTERHRDPSCVWTLPVAIWREDVGPWSSWLLADTGVRAVLSALGYCVSQPLALLSHPVLAGSPRWVTSALGPWASLYDTVGKGKG